MTEERLPAFVTREEFNRLMNKWDGTWAQVQNLLKKFEPLTMWTQGQTERIDGLSRTIADEKHAVDDRFRAMGAAHKAFTEGVDAKLQSHADRHAAAKGAMEKDLTNQLLGLGGRVDSVHNRQEKLDSAFGDRMLSVEQRLDDVESAGGGRNDVLEGLGGRMDQFEKAIAAADRQLDDVQRRQDQADQSEKERRAAAVGQNPNEVELEIRNEEPDLEAAVRVVLAAGGSVSFGGGR